MRANTEETKEVRPTIVQAQCSDQVSRSQWKKENPGGGWWTRTSEGDRDNFPKRPMN